MISVRYGTFETNSSSCHSITIFRDKKDWDDFKNHFVYINRNAFEIDEHKTIFDVINSENRTDYIRPIHHLYEKISEFLDDTTDPFCSKYHSDAKDEAIWRYLKDNWSEDLMIKILTANGKEIIFTPKKPVKVKYTWSGYESKVYTYNYFTVADFYDFMFGYGVIANELPKFYIYGDDGDWQDAVVEEYINKETGKEMVMVTRDEEC